MSFLRNYLTYNSGNECPDQYHIWSALSILSSVISCKVYVDRSYFIIYPNLYITLVGEQGTRKTTAKDIAYDLMKASCPLISTSSECESKQFITKYLSDLKQQRTYKNHSGTIVTYTPYSIFATELKNFLAVDPVGMVDFLTAIYDRTGKIYDAKTKGKGEDLLISPYINFLACETPEWLTYRLKDSVISGGFCRRMVFVYEIDPKPPVPFPIITKEAAIAKVECMKWLVKIKDIHGKFEWGDGAKEWFIPWYAQTKNKNHENSFMAGWYSSKDAQLLKVAMLVALSESTDLILTVPYLQTALEIIDNTEINLPKLVASIGRNELAGPTLKIVDMIAKAGGVMPEMEARKRTVGDFSPAEFFNAINHLKSTEQIVVGKIDLGGILKIVYMTKAYYDQQQKKESK